MAGVSDLRVRKVQVIGNVGRIEQALSGLGNAAIPATTIVPEPDTVELTLAAVTPVDADARLCNG